jgi:hypothetical protein
MMMHSQTATQRAADFEPGVRVETMPHTDAWMAGDRYGEVVLVDYERDLVEVELQASGRTTRFAPCSIHRVSREAQDAYDAHADA